MYRGLIIWWEFEHITARTVDNAIGGKRKIKEKQTISTMRKQTGE